MQHTTETPKQYQCRHIFTDGHRCASPCLRQEEFCYYHHTTRKPIANPKQRRSRRSTFHLPLPEDRSAIQASIGEVLQRIAANDIDPRRAGLLLYGLQIASLNLPKPQTLTKTETQTVEEITIDPALGVLAPRTDISETAKPKSAVALLLEQMMQSEQEEEAATPESATIPTLQATADDRSSPVRLPHNHKIKRRRHPGRRSFSTPTKGGVIPTEPRAQSRGSGGTPAFSFCRCLFSSEQPRTSPQPKKTSFRPKRSAVEKSASPPQLSQPTILPALTRGSYIPCPPEHRAYRQNSQ
jgi:hypothetical protein